MPPLKCIYAEETPLASFPDLSPNGGETTHFICKCGFNLCRCPERVPPAVRPFDAAGIHSHTRYTVDGQEKTDYIIVKRKFCDKRACINYKETYNDEACDLRDLQGRDRER